MQDAGYDVHLQKYQFDYYAYTGIPTMSVGGTNLVLGADWGPGQSLGSMGGQTLTAVNNNVLPPTATPSSAAGCAAGDFGPEVSGHPVLIQRGTCTFAQKVANAQAAGATGVIIFNEGNTEPDRTGLLIGSLGSVPTIPVVFVTFAVGNEMAQEIAAGNPPSPTVDIKAIFQPNADDWNVIADSKGGDKNHTLVVDAHLDAIYGAGMLDNGSGSMAILDIAQMMKNVNPANHLRFIWFGGEALGPLRIGVLRQQPDLDAGESHQLRPRRGRVRDAELHHRSPRSRGAGPVQQAGAGDVREQGLQAVAGRARPGDRVLRQGRLQPRADLAERHRRDLVQPHRRPGQRPAHRAELLQDA
jgi:hypothetical protein